MKVGFNQVSFKSNAGPQIQGTSSAPINLNPAFSKPTINTNEQKINTFKERLIDENWEKKFIKESNIIHIKHKNLIDGLEYEVTPDGKVTEVGTWMKPNVILEKDKDAINLFKKDNKTPNSPNKKSGIKDGIAGIWKFFTTTNQMVNSAIKGLVYGAVAGIALLSGSWLFKTLPSVFAKEGPKFTQILRHPLKNISKSGKIIAGIGAAAVMAYQMITGKLTANQKTAVIDHKLKTGHRDA